MVAISAFHREAASSQFKRFLVAGLSMRPSAYRRRASEFLASRTVLILAPPPNEIARLGDCFEVQVAGHVNLPHSPPPEMPRP
jgi:hypothetical protein